MPIQYVQVFGERCSGTNFLCELLQRNMKSAVLRLANWKHGVQTDQLQPPRDWLIIVLYRDPFDWIRSFFRTPYHVAPRLLTSLEAFMQNRWDCAQFEPGGDAVYDHVWHLRRCKIHAWQQLEHIYPHWTDVRYEDLCAQPQAFLQKLHQQFGMQFDESFVPVVQTCRADIVYPVPFVPRSYLEFSKEQIAIIRQLIDRETETRIGYGASLEHYLASC